MLADDLPRLSAYIKQSQDVELLKWWAHYLESTQQLDAAVSYYAHANDILSLVRVYCYQGDFDKVCVVKEKNPRCLRAHTETPGWFILHGVQ